MDCERLGWETDVGWAGMGQTGGWEDGMLIRPASAPPYMY